MAQTLGSASLVLSTNAGPMNAGLNQAEKKISGFIGNIGGGISMIGGPWVAAATAGIGLVSGAWGMVSGHVAEAMDRVDVFAKKGRTLGLSFGDMAGLDFAGQLSGVEDMAGIAGKFSKNVGELGAGSKSAEAAFGQLGITAEDMKGKDLTGQIALVADKMSAIEDPAQRARLALDIFGKQGLAMVPALEAGGDAFKAMVEEGKELSGGLTETDTGNIEAALDSWTKVESAIKGIWNIVAAGLAPAMEFVGDVLTDIIKDSMPFFKALMRDVLDLTNGLLQTLGYVVDAMKMGHEFFTTGEAKTEFGDMASKVDKFFQNLDQRLAGKKKSPLDPVRQKLVEDIKKLGEDLDKEFAIFGKNKGEAKLFDLKKEGASDRDLAEVRKKIDRNLGQEIKFKADPTLALDNKMKDLDRLVGNGSITWEQYGFAVNEALAEAEKALGISNEMKNPQMAFEGSREAVESIIKANQEAQAPATMEERLARITTEQLAQQKAQTGVLKQMLEKMRGVEEKKPDEILTD